MKYFFILFAFTITIKDYAQVSKPVATQKNVPLSPSAKIIFKDIKTQLTNEEKNFFSKDVYVQKADKTRLTIDENGEDQGVMDVEIHPTDLNKDGIEEIFTRTSGTFFGQWLPDLVVYIKNKDGKYIYQEGVSSPRLYVHAIGVGGYPDLIGGQPEGPGFNHPVAKIDTYRWDGTKYKLYKKNQAKLKTDKSIDEVVSPAYVKTIPANSMENNMAANPETNNALTVTHTETKNETAGLTPLTAMLFGNVKTKLSDAEKNDFIQKTGITPADTVKTKKGKPKTKFTMYPTDLNNDGTEEIFLCVTTSPLGIPLNNYFFYAKDNYGKYQPLPGKIGQGVKLILNGKSGYPDLINGVPGLARQIWSWDGKAYRLKQTLNSSINIPYQTKDIDRASAEYTAKM